jgi:prepilin-type processing-associated H-X9-DG protein
MYDGRPTVPGGPCGWDRMVDGRHQSALNVLWADGHGTQFSPEMEL